MYSNSACASSVCEKVVGPKPDQPDRLLRSCSECVVWMLRLGASRRIIVWRVVGRPCLQTKRIPPMKVLSDGELPGDGPHAAVQAARARTAI